MFLLYLILDFEDFKQSSDYTFGESRAPPLFFGNVIESQRSKNSKFVGIDVFFDVPISSIELFTNMKVLNEYVSLSCKIQNTKLKGSDISISGCLRSYSDIGILAISASCTDKSDLKIEILIQQIKEMLIALRLPLDYQRLYSAKRGLSRKFAQFFDCDRTRPFIYVDNVSS